MGRASRSYGSWIARLRVRPASFRLIARNARRKNGSADGTTRSASQHRSSTVKGDGLPPVFPRARKAHGGRRCTCRRSNAPYSDQVFCAVAVLPDDTVRPRWRLRARALASVTGQQAFSLTGALQFFYDTTRRRTGRQLAHGLQPVEVGGPCARQTKKKKQKQKKEQRLHQARRRGPGRPPQPFAIWTCG